MTELEEYFIFKTQQGLTAHGLADKPEYVARLKFETDTILKMGFAGYFLIVQDFINWAKNNDIYVGPGRGSAAGSLVAYCLNITGLDPIKWDLMFERFLNPARVSMPDIDIDIEKRYRDRVIEYVTKRYGEDHVAHIGTFNVMRAKAAVKSVTKTLGHPYQIGDMLSKLMLPPVHGKSQSLKESIEKVSELYEFRSGQGTEGQILRWAERVEGLVSSVGVHASGIVISNKSLKETVPLFLGKSDEVATQWEMNTIDQVGLIKFDLLGLDALTKIHRCVDMIHETTGTRINIDKIPLDDEETFVNLRSGDSVGVFQLEASSGMRDLLVQIRPTSIEDITALVAIYRPGPLNSDYKQTYLNVRAGLESPSYLVPELEPILKKTAGWMIYQEQVLQIAKDLAGYSLADADLLRRAIGKKKEKEMRAHEAKFKDGWREHGLSSESGDEMWQQIVVFADYAFNRSHAAAYAFLTYQTAWLKTHYPTEFMCAVMVSESGNQDDIIKCITECARIGIKMLPPSVNNSNENFTISGKKQIQFGLAPVKNLGEKPVSLIIAERNQNGKFKSLKDFCQRVDLSIINRLKLESLILAGAFDEFGDTRATMMHLVEQIWDYRDKYKAYQSKFNTYTKRADAYAQRLAEIQEFEEGKRTGKKPSTLKQPEAPIEPIWPSSVNLDELPEHDIQQKEHELLGYYLTSHPLDSVQKQLSYLNTIEDVKEMQGGLSCSLGAVIVGIKEITTSTSKKKMAFVSLEDKQGAIEATAFPAAYEKYKEYFIPGIPLRVDAKVEVTETDEGRLTKLMIQKLSLFDRYREKEKEQSQKVSVIVKATKTLDLIELFKRYHGNVHEIEIILELMDGTQMIVPPIKIGEGKSKFLKELSRIIND